MSDFRFLVTNGKLWSKKLNCYKERKFAFAKNFFWVHRWGVAGATRAGEILHISAVPECLCNNSI